ncbi:MurR/RpiR family transcriptional regulator [Paenibacillus sp. WLX2291]|uniref:MurR/RpiR family transcriptional regulator n=1 Tax=Paenibacillus sp. WLX2291 TaxID=3296934 RepID=UPI003984189B
MNGGLVRLREIIHTITPSERKVASFILEQPQRLVGMSVAQLAEQSGGSQAAVIRLCKSAGFKGYQELMLKVAGDLQEQSQSQSGYQEINPDDSIERIIENVSANNIQSIRDTVKILNPASIEQAVQALLDAKRIFFFGIGASNLIATDAQHKFLRINKTCFAFADADLQLISSVMLTPDDTVVGISYSGKTPVTVECMKIAREAGARTISITRYGNTPVGNLADIPLHISSTENEIRSGATSSRITQLNVIDILYLAVASRDYEQSVTYLEKSRNIVRKSKR